MNFFTADLHFGHQAVIGYANRPFGGAEEMNRELVRRWNETVTQDDIVYVVGDFSFLTARMTDGIVKNLRGTKVLIRGNHDGKNCRSFALVFHEVTMKLAGETVRLCHYPYSGDHTGEDRYLERRPRDDGKWLIHGHVHNAWKQRDRQICVSVENWDYRPVPAPELEKIIQRGNHGD